MPATLMTASAMTTSASTAVISLTRSGVRPGQPPQVPPCQRLASMSRVMPTAYDDGSRST